MADAAPPHEPHVKVECFPYTIDDLEPELNAELLQYFRGERTGFVQVGPERYFFPAKFKSEALDYYNFEARPDDIWIVTVPRSGTTWTQELVWLVANELNFEEAKSRLLTERFPFFEFPLLLHDELKAELLVENEAITEHCAFIERISQPCHQTLNDWPKNRRRFIKTHFPFSLLPPSVMRNGCKIVYVARNPKDVAVSYYHLNRLYRTLDYVGEFPRYWHYFMAGLNPWLPYHSHLREAQANRSRPNVLFLNYEDMLSDLRSAILKVADFLDCKLAPDGLENLINHLNIKNFRENTSVNGHEMATVGVLNQGKAGFVRRGNGDAEEAVGEAERSKSEQLEFANNPLLLQTANEWIAKQTL